MRRRPVPARERVRPARPGAVGSRCSSWRRRRRPVARARRAHVPRATAREAGEAIGELTMGVDHHAVQGALAVALSASRCSPPSGRADVGTSASPPASAPATSGWCRSRSPARGQAFSPARGRPSASAWGVGGRGARARRAPVQLRELGGEVVEAERALRQRRHVPGLEVEVGAAGLPGRLAALQPGPLAQLVADRLPGDAEVADQLAVEEGEVGAGVLAQEGPRQLRRPRLPAVLGQRALGVVGDRQPEVHADVDDHPHRAQLLRVEVAQPLTGVGEVARARPSAARRTAPSPRRSRPTEPSDVW